MRLFNTLARQVEELTPLEPGVVKMYTCGPTVYRDVHIGNLRSYLMADWIRRALEYQGYKVIHVKNITDVGHMRQEMLERGEDKVIAAALASGRTPQQIAEEYTCSFYRDEREINILPAHYFPKATDHIQEMIQLTQKLLDQEAAYEAGGNIYFDVSRYSDYGRLSGNLNPDLLEGVRVEADPLKDDPRDFTLWKAAEPGRALKWDSPWGEGFPGWHIECSAMSFKYLGPRLDIHTGGVDNIFPHHEGERAQSEQANGGPYVRHWVHGQHLLADGVKMAKSAANDYTLADLKARFFDPMSFRYLCLTAKYRNRLNFTFSALKAAQRGLQRLRNRVWELSLEKCTQAVATEVERSWHQAFLGHINDDLDLPGALSLIWRMLRSGLPNASKLRLLLKFDQVLGLGLAAIPSQFRVSAEIQGKLSSRADLKNTRQFERADAIRQEVRGLGYVVEDVRAETRARPKSALEKLRERWTSYSSSREMPSLLSSPDRTDYSLNIVARDFPEDVERCVNSLLPWADFHSFEILIVDNGSSYENAAWLEDLAKNNSRIRAIHTDHVLGDAQARNIGLKQSLGSIIIIIDPSVEVLGDIFTPMGKALEEREVGLVGPWGLRSDERLHHFHEEIEEGEADAMQFYCMAFRRELIRKVGFMRESFRFYRNLDIDFSFHFKDKGYRVMAIPGLPLKRHQHREWERLSPEERDNLSRKNWRRMFKKWGRRQDLLVNASNPRTLA